MSTEWERNARKKLIEYGIGSCSTYINNLPLKEREKSNLLKKCISNWLGLPLEKAHSIQVASEHRSGNREDIRKYTGFKILNPEIEMNVSRINTKPEEIAECEEGSLITSTSEDAEKFKKWCFTNISPSPWASKKLSLEPSQNLNGQELDPEKESAIIQKEFKYEIPEYTFRTGRKVYENDKAVSGGEMRKDKETGDVDLTIFREIGIKCPSCGKEILFDPTTFKKGEIIEKWCEQCEFEFYIPIKTTEGENLFIENVIIRGFHEKIWDPDRFIAGGGLYGQPTFGVDFLVYSIRRGKRGGLWIEHKYSDKFQFTPAQLVRFRKSIDKPWVATRFCGITHLIEDPTQVGILCYWTPNFIRVIPEKAFHQYGNRDVLTFKFLGLEKVLNVNTFTEFKELYSKEELNQLLQTPNITIYQLNQGRIGYRGARYETMPLEQAFDILYQKLKFTALHLDEDIDGKYQKHTRNLPEAILKGDYLNTKVIEFISNSYRPLYVSDLVSRFEYDAVIGPQIEWRSRRQGGSNRPWLGEHNLSGLILNIARRGVREGFLQNFTIPNYSRYAYGIKGRKYISLTQEASRFLEDLGEILHAPETFIGLPDLSKRLGVSYGTEKSRFNISKNELMSGGKVPQGVTKKPLILVEKRGRANLIALSQKAFDYIKRIGVFKT